MNCYVIHSNDGRYVAEPQPGHWVLVQNANDACLFPTKAKATNILHNSLPVAERNKCAVVSLDISPSDVGLTSFAPQPDRFVDPAPIQIKSAETPSYKSIQKYASEINKFSDLMNQIPERRADLERERQQVELAIIDIQHYMELGNLNASDGWRAYKLMQSYLQKRRIIKDEAALLESLDAAVSRDLLDNAKSSIDNLGTRSYHPRVLPELFANDHKSKK